MATVRASYLLEVNWSGSGTLQSDVQTPVPLWLAGEDDVEVDEDISRLVHIEAGMSWSYGRDRASQLTGRSIAGTLECTLLNNDGRFSSFNTASPLYGLLVPGRKVRLRAYYNGAIYLLWEGFLSEIGPDATGWFKTAKLRAHGPLAKLNDPLAKVTVAMTANVLTGAAMGLVLDAVGWPADKRTLDTGRTTIGRFWAKGQNALSALRSVEETEAGFLRETRDGKVAFEDRHHRLLSPHTVPQATHTQDSDGVLWYVGVAQKDPWSEVYNRFTADVQLYDTGALAVLWTLAASGVDSPAIEAGASREFWASYPNPASAAANGVAVDTWTTPVATTDFTANAAADGSGANLTGDITIAVSKFDNSMKITLTNGASVKAYVTFLQARGTPVLAKDPIPVEKEDAASISAYGERTYPNPAPYLPSLQEAEDWGDFQKSIYKDPIPMLTVDLAANASHEHMVEVMTRDVSDRVTVVAQGAVKLGINRDFFIEAARHHVGEGNLHSVTYECSPADAFGGFIVLDFGPGLDTGRLAY